MAAESLVERWVRIGGWSLGFAHLCFTCHTLVSRLQTSVSDGLQLGSLGDTQSHWMGLHQGRTRT